MAFKHRCVNCRGAFEVKRHDADFCSNACRQDFHNRRLQRGAVLYDLLMLEEVDPDTFQRLGLDGTVSAVIAAFKQEDAAAKRKRSYKSPKGILTDTLRFRVSGGG